LEDLDMATERTTGGDTTVIETDRGGSGGAGWLIALAVIAFLAIGAFFLMNATRNDNLQTAAVSGAASSVAGSVDQAADSVSGAADNAKDAVTPAE
jgi:hypothetical protein